MSGYTGESPVSPQITPRPSSTVSSLSFTIFRCLVTPRSLPSLPRSLPDHHPQPPHYLYYFQMSGYTGESPVYPKITPRPSSTASSLSFTFFRCLVTPGSLPSLPRSLPDHHPQPPHYLLLFSDVWLHRGVSRLSPEHSPTIIHSLLTIFTIFRCLVTPGSLPSIPRSLPDHHPQPPHYLLIFSDVWLHRGVSRLSPDHSPTIIHSLLTIFYYFQMSGYTGESPVSPQNTPRPSSTASSLSFTFFRCLVTPGSLPSLPRSLPDHHPQPRHLLPPYHLVRTDTAFYTDGHTDS